MGKLNEKVTALTVALTVLAGGIGITAAQILKGNVKESDFGITEKAVEKEKEKGTDIISIYAYPEEGITINGLNEKYQGQITVVGEERNGRFINITNAAIITSGNGEIAYALKSDEIYSNDIEGHSELKVNVVVGEDEVLTDIVGVEVKESEEVDTEVDMEINN
ncbi:MAG TPA: hypothetical protein DEP72_06985 [Clostridiales bacterium]|nr:MAG: hypothetical protein A2Y18_07910 [Clostridiales bacterium GWD2_32_19]HCC07885.1 hypothetical protein [Clostridiales bacterium]